MGFWDKLKSIFGGSASPKPEDVPFTPTDETLSSSSSGATATAATKKYQLGELSSLSADELRAQAASTGWWFSPWRWRRDVIPPLADPHTSLVDRSMVLRGVVTEGELRALHDVGDEWLKLKDPRLAGRIAGQAKGDVAIEALRAARAALKAEKRAQSAARSAARRADIEARKQSDIVFLGRGVSTSLSDRVSHVERLEARGLPVLHTAGDVARALDLTISQLRGLCFHSDATPRAHYVQFDVPKKSGGVRRLAAPKPMIAKAQRWVHDHVLAKLDVDDAAHGFVTARSTVTNAKPHEKQELVANLDLENFFPTITVHRVRGMFASLGYSGAVSSIFALLCTESPRVEVGVAPSQRLWVAIGPRALPQGACTSPSISNQIARRLDRRLTSLAARHGWRYTRYADDLTLSASGDACGSVKRVLAAVHSIVRDQGFKVHERKQRVLRSSARQEVTGIVVNTGQRVAREEMRKLRAILYDASRFGLEQANREKRANFPSWLRGKLAYVAMIDPIRGQAMLEQLDAIEQR